MSPSFARIPAGRAVVRVVGYGLMLRIGRLPQPEWGVAMSRWLTGAILGTAFRSSLLLVVQRMPFPRRPSVDKWISPYLRDSAGEPGPFTPVELNSPFYAVFRLMARIGRLLQAERVLR